MAELAPEHFFAAQKNPLLAPAVILDSRLELLSGEGSLQAVGLFGVLASLERGDGVRAKDINRSFSIKATGKNHTIASAETVRLNSFKKYPNVFKNIERGVWSVFDEDERLILGSILKSSGVIFSPVQQGLIDDALSASQSDIKIARDRAERIKMIRNGEKAGAPRSRIEQDISVPAVTAAKPEGLKHPIPIANIRGEQAVHVSQEARELLWILINNDCVAGMQEFMDLIEVKVPGCTYAWRLKHVQQLVDAGEIVERTGHYMTASFAEDYGEGVYPPRMSEETIQRTIPIVRTILANQGFTFRLRDVIEQGYRLGDDITYRTAVAFWHRDTQRTFQVLEDLLGSCPVEHNGVSKRGSGYNVAKLTSDQVETLKTHFEL